MAAPVEYINHLLASGKYRVILSMIKGFRNGAVYGCKIRFPHALVMAFLFKNGSLASKFKFILEATLTHAKNLALLTTSYKGLSGIFEWLQSEKTQVHTLVAASISGYLVFGKYNKVNEQVNLYLLSRILYAGVKVMQKRGYFPQTERPVFPWFAAFVWGIVLWLFENEKETLQSSLLSSMTYIYSDSNYWTNIWNFFVYNE
ncbi:peroxisomal membrane protein 4-like [Tubulanus polymorphus]|uniref:peroxisomal membrane protein 4-like n=1 Tax=Tubulanus polymorphus TaxID=672921 RepID=UPI003DA4320B